MNTLIITGGNNGIGYHMVEEWLDKGGNAAVIDLECSNIEKLQSKFRDRLIFFKYDVRDIDALNDAVNKTVDKFGDIDYAIHNACLCLFKSLDDHTIDDYKNVMSVNFHGAINLTNAVLPTMKTQNSGKIFFTSSGVGVSGFIDISSYSASKGAIESFAKCMNIEYMDSGVTFHIFHPPLTDTESSSPLPVPKEFKASAKKVAQGLIKHINSKKFIIAPSFGTSISVKLTYLFPISMGRLLAKMTANANTK